MEVRDDVRRQEKWCFHGIDQNFVSEFAFAVLLAFIVCLVGGLLFMVVG